ncbi:MAG: hypothetical protein SV760_07720 [Halobacteria archaeon]|nr:hypothetical protein [Halobacteria archaeon]
MTDADDATGDSSLEADHENPDPETTANAEDVDWPVAFEVAASYTLDPKENTVRTQKVKDAYGIDFEVGELDVVDSLELEVDRGDIVFATGASGAGKTTVCEQIADRLDAVAFSDVRVERGVPLIETFPDDFDVDETQKYMGMFGLGDAHLNLRTYEELSQGQKYRAKLAYTAARYDVVFADEFAATLDRETAKTIAFSIRRQTLKDRLDATFIFATTHRDLIPDLRPDVLLDFDENAVRRLEDAGVDLDETYELDRPSADGGTPLSRPASSTETTPTYRSLSPINSNSPQEPSRTGRTSIGGITSAIRSDQS